MGSLVLFYPNHITAKENLITVVQNSDEIDDDRICILVKTNLYATRLFSLGSDNKRAWKKL